MQSLNYKTRPCEILSSLDKMQTHCFTKLYIKPLITSLYGDWDTFYHKYKTMLYPFVRWPFILSLTVYDKIVLIFFMDML